MFALLESERSEGKALVCTARPTGDVTIEAEVAQEDVVFHPVPDFTATVTLVEDCTRDIRRIQLQLDDEICFNPGQYVQVQIPGAGLTHSWSIASPPSAGNSIELNIRRTPGGSATASTNFRLSAANQAPCLPSCETAGWLRDGPAGVPGVGIQKSVEVTGTPPDVERAVAEVDRIDGCVSIAF